VTYAAADLAWVEAQNRLIARPPLTAMDMSGYAAGVSQQYTRSTICSLRSTR
jgi:hypothetical protein